MAAKEQKMPTTNVKRCMKCGKLILTSVDKCPFCGGKLTENTPGNKKQYLEG